MAIRYIIFYIILLIACICDVRYYKIPNWFIIISLFFGFFFCVFTWDFQVIISYLFGFFVALVFGFAGYRFRVFGAGDGKLYAVIGLFLGAPFFFKVFLLSIVLGGLYALYYVIHALFRGIGGYVESIDWLRDGKKLKVSDSRVHKLHMAVPIALAAIIVIGRG